MRRSRPSPVSQQIVLRLHLLQHQLFTNVCPVPSAHSGGLHGHLVLAMLLTDTDYLTRAGVAHIVPLHPGPPPLLVGTGVIIAVAFWAYTDALSNVTLYNNLSSAALTPQLLTAVKTSFLSVLEDPDFGFRGFTPCAMLTHLHNKYGTPTPEEMEKNRAALLDPWNLDDRIVDFWAKIASNIQRVATFGKRPHCRYHIITHTLAMFEKTGLLLITAESSVYVPATTNGRLPVQVRETRQQGTLVCRLTASKAGFHRAHSVLRTPTPIAGTPPVPLPLSHATLPSKVEKCSTAGPIVSAHIHHILA